MLERLFTVHISEQIWFAVFPGLTPDAALFSRLYMWLGSTSRSFSFPGIIFLIVFLFTLCMLMSRLIPTVIKKPQIAKEATYTTQY